MCGKDEPLYKAMIESTELNVCRACAGHGKVLRQPVFQQKIKKKKKEEQIAAEEEKEIIEALVEGYPKKVKDARQRLGLKQEELAKKLNEKESIIQKIEVGSFKPSAKLAKKLERFLSIKIFEEVEVKKIESKKSSSEGFTLGDFIKKR